MCAFPVGWPPRPAEGRRSIRYYLAGSTTTHAYSDNAYLFADQTTANTFLPTPVVAPGAERTQVDFGNTSAGGTPMGGALTTATDPHPMIWPKYIRVYNDGLADIEISFDGTNTHGLVKSATSVTFRDRLEAGISVRRIAAGAAVGFRIEAW